MSSFSVFSLIRFSGLAAAALVLQACGSASQGSWQQYSQFLRQAVRSSTGSGRISREQAAEIPYASLGYRVNGSNQGLLVLATDTNGDLLWTSVSRIVLLTRGGRIVRSIGLPHDRAAMVARGAGSLPPLADAIKAPFRSVRLVDLPDSGAYGMPLTCMTTPRGPQAVTILGTALATIRVDETCQSENRRWQFTDSYWLDAKTFFPWRSVQHLHPGGTEVEIEIFRAPE